MGRVGIGGPTRLFRLVVGEWKFRRSVPDVRVVIVVVVIVVVVIVVVVLALPRPTPLNGARVVVAGQVISRCDTAGSHLERVASRLCERARRPVGR
jgi:hypothetical protein